MRPSVVLLLWLGFGAYAGADYEFAGHSKVRLIGSTFPAESVIRPLAGAKSFDLEGDLRLNLAASSRGWTFAAAYQLFGLNGDRVEYTREVPAGSEIFFRRFDDDQRRLFDLTHVLHDEGGSARLHRLDRLWVGHSSAATVVRVGRQAISWGNGLFYSPMDLVNPFDPAAIDTEYKAGDDMLYAQYLLDSGNDIQAAVVIRRSILTSDIESGEFSYAVKYHQVSGESEYDLLLARSYGDPVLGVGGVRSIGGTVIRSDLVITDNGPDIYIQFVANLSYSWSWVNKNVSGSIEYYFSEFGQHNQQYDPANLAANPDLLTRLGRGELFTLGRHYLAGSLMIELSPLWTLTPTLLMNMDDPSALLQIIVQHSLSDNVVILGSLSIPLGSNGTEFGGIDSGIDDLYFSSGPGFFTQIAAYF